MNHFLFSTFSLKDPCLYLFLFCVVCWVSLAFLDLFTMSLKTQISLSLQRATITICLSFLCALRTLLGHIDVFRLILKSPALWQWTTIKIPLSFLCVPHTLLGQTCFCRLNLYFHPFWQRATIKIRLSFPCGPYTLLA